MQSLWEALLQLCARRSLARWLRRLLCLPPAACYRCRALCAVHGSDGIGNHILLVLQSSTVAVLLVIKCYTCVVDGARTALGGGGVDRFKVIRSISEVIRAIALNGSLHLMHGSMPSWLNDVGWQSTLDAWTHTALGGGGVDRRCRCVLLRRSALAGPNETNPSQTRDYTRA